MLIIFSADQCEIQGCRFRSILEIYQQIYGGKAGHSGSPKPVVTKLKPFRPSTCRNCQRLESQENINKHKQNNRYNTKKRGGIGKDDSEINKQTNKQRKNGILVFCFNLHVFLPKTNTRKKKNTFTFGVPSKKTRTQEKSPLLMWFFPIFVSLGFTSFCFWICRGLSICVSCSCDFYTSLFLCLRFVRIAF